MEIQKIPKIKIETHLSESKGWKKIELDHSSFWYSGYTYKSDLKAIAKELDGIENVPTRKQLTEKIRAIHGHFAFIYICHDYLLASVDKIRSIPIFFSETGSTIHITSSATRLVDALELGPQNIEKKAALSFAMSGYVTGHGTLYKELSSLKAGYYLFAPTESDQPIVDLIRYFQYAPWQVIDAPKDVFRDQLKETTLEILSNLLESIGDRQIIIPLSGGYDSRLIASGLKHLGASNIKLFTYGLKSSFERKIGKSVADSLSLPWIFVPINNKTQRKYYHSKLYKDYIHFADSCISLPFQQDVPVVDHLRKINYIASDSVIVNGNSGDYISGGHVPEFDPQNGLSEQERWQVILFKLINKHYGLWKELNTPENIELIGQVLRNEFELEGVGLIDPALDFSLFEYSEFMNRQSKYVITGQRSYEFLGYEWRLPLWDDDYLYFWQTVPYHLKRKQYLYRFMLQSENWSDVWCKIPANYSKKSPVDPVWLIPIRTSFKVLHALSGIKQWQEFDRRFFRYWMEALCSYARFSYFEIVFDKRHHKNSISWSSDYYLREKLKTDKIFNNWLK